MIVSQQLFHIRETKIIITHATLISIQHATHFVIYISTHCLIIQSHARSVNYHLNIMILNGYN